MLVETIILDEKKLNLEVLKQLFECFKYEALLDEDQKLIFIEKKHYIPFTLSFSKRKSQITLSVVIDAQKTVDELALARFAQKLNNRSTFCNFQYRMSKIDGPKLGGSATILTFKGLQPNHLYYLTERFCAEFLRLCFDPSAKNILYFKRGKLMVNRPT